LGEGLAGLVTSTRAERTGVSWQVEGRGWLGAGAARRVVGGARVVRPAERHVCVAEASYVLPPARHAPRRRPAWPGLTHPPTPPPARSTRVARASAQPQAGPLLVHGSLSAFESHACVAISADFFAARLCVTVSRWPISPTQHCAAARLVAPASLEKLSIVLLESPARGVCLTRRSRGHEAPCAQSAACERRVGARGRVSHVADGRL